MPAISCDVAQIRDYLKRALKHGARAEHLVEYNLDFIDYLCPASEYPNVSCDDRAFRVQRRVERAAYEIGGDLGQAAEILYGLRRGTDIPLEKRREHAAALVGVEPETFRKHWQHHVITDLAYRIYEHLMPDSASCACGESHVAQGASAPCQHDRITAAR